MRSPDPQAASAARQERSTLALLWDSAIFRKSIVLILLALAWEIYAGQLNNPLLFPSLSDTVLSLFENVASGRLPARAVSSLSVLLIGYALGVAIAFALTIFAITSRIGTDFLETVTAMLNPLPAIALLPLALIWFGLGDGSLIFVLIHSVLWVVALNTLSGFRGVSQTLRMVGRNYGLGGLAFVSKILIPAAFPSILTGLKIGWAFAWRTLIAAELVFGAASGQGGLGWFIFESRNTLDIPGVFAGLLTVIIIGLLMDSIVFRTIERATLDRWGMRS
ncbi:ABC transporter permease [Bradyrhizobium sp. NP1]|uniref:ABC transporter permease n=1 Tax=Bradyrhizobium sp. NP1 TaxID=3049772 RepID=UPI0025A52AE0|nr:ABC transporter permease [Bradyrhizobium sp. NP1]WJR81933.1 ABC transporter permease [Bradyrhizobium sp. NP1]